MFFQEYYQCVKHFGSRSGQLLVKTVCKLAGKELKQLTKCKSLS